MSAAYITHFSDSFVYTRFQPSISTNKFMRVKFPFVKVSVPPVRQTFHICSIKNRATNGRDGSQNLHYNYQFEREPFWLSLVRDFAWGMRELVGFLVDQPSQLKYIEWPSFQSTLKTATLTLIIVAFLIVALCSVDSALCYSLAWFLRKSA